MATHITIGDNNTEDSEELPVADNNTEQLLQAILVELRMMNQYNILALDEEITPDDDG